MIAVPQFRLLAITSYTYLHAALGADLSSSIMPRAPRVHAMMSPLESLGFPHVRHKEGCGSTVPPSGLVSVLGSLAGTSARHEGAFNVRDLLGRSWTFITPEERHFSVVGCGGCTVRTFVLKV